MGQFSDTDLDSPDSNDPSNENEGLSFSFVEAEHQVLKFWKEKNIFKKSLDQTRKGRPYIFYDGPPFATGLPHHGHLVASTLKDIIPRYFTMKGYYVLRRFGWDCHGLPIEQEIDKKFGKSAQETVLEKGVKAYNDECRKIVGRFTLEWEKTISRIGRWVDFVDDYKTMDVTFMESVWWVFKELWNKGLVYQGDKVVPISTAFGTVLSNFEATSNYQSVQDPSLTVLFKLKEKVAGDDCFVAVWTTTPWTLPSNLGLCVRADLTYVRVRDEQRKVTFYMVQDRLAAYNKKNNPLTVIDSCLGSELKGKAYHPLMPYFSSLEKEGAFRIFNDDYVTTEDGTGVVHLAPAFGEDDNRVFKVAGLSLSVVPVDVNGRFTKEVPDLEGQYIKDADKQIIRKLKEEGVLYDQSVLVHNYPFCPRSDTPLMYRSITSWYVNVEKIKSDLIAANEEIRWVPEHIKEGRFGKWLEGARDWAISRNRVWGTPLPIWINDVTGKTLCLGSIAELEKYTGLSTNSAKGEKITDLHRENVDPLTFTVPGEEGTYRRVPEVLDCWFESGSMPFAQLHYPFENQEVFRQGFPAEFIAEGLDQTRGWFYTLTVLSAALFKKPAFKNVIVNGLVLASDGKKMSKRLQNYTAPDVLMEKFGADALRLFLINSGVVRGEELRFTDEGVKDMVRRSLLPWFNSFKFFQTYAEVDGWNPEKDLTYGENILDRWILSKLQTLIDTVSTEMEAYHLYNVVPALFNFIEDLTNWYIRLNRRRFWEKGLSRDKKEAYSALYTSLKNISALMAPFAPFLSEFIYLELKKMGGLPAESVHLLTFPAPQKNMISPALEDAVERMQQIILLGRQKRNQKQIKVKIPLNRLTIIHKDKTLLDEIQKLETFIKGELNVKRVEYSQEESKYIDFFARPNSPVLGKRLGKDFAKFRPLIEKLPSKVLEQLEEKGEMTLEGEIFRQEDVLIFRSPRPNTEALSNRLISIDMDCLLTPELVQEGLAREVVNRIQKTRKEMNFKVSDQVFIQYDGDKEIKEVLNLHQKYITEETLCNKFSASSFEDKGPGIFTFSIEQHVLKIKIEIFKDTIFSKI